MTIYYSEGSFPAMTMQGVLREQFPNSPPKPIGDDTKIFVPIMPDKAFAFIYQQTLISEAEAFAQQLTRVPTLEDVHATKPVDEVPLNYRLWRAGMLSFRVGFALINDSVLLVALPVQGDMKTRYRIVLTEAAGNDDLTAVNVEDHPFYRRFGSSDLLIAKPDDLPSFIRPTDCVNFLEVRRAWLAKPSRS